MTVPTGGETSIYGASVKKHEVRCRVQLDYPVFSSPIDDGFTALNAATWASYVPDGGTIGAGTALYLTSTSADGITKGPYAYSKPGFFPYSQGITWTLEWSAAMGSTTLGTTAYIGYRNSSQEVVGIGPEGGAIVQITANQNLGSIEVHIPSNVIKEYLPLDGAYRTYSLQFTGSQFILSRDGAVKGSVAWGPRQADYVKFGGHVQEEPGPGHWPRIWVDYIRFTAYSTTESWTVPSWAVGGTFSVDGRTCAYLPTVLSGRINIDKGNTVDACELTLANYGPPGSAVSGTAVERGLYRGFRWQNRDLTVESRIQGAGSWSSWKQIFTGTGDECSYNIDEREPLVTVRARDKVRRKLQRTTISRTYGSFTAVAPEAKTGLAPSAIMTDLCRFAGLAASEYTIDSWPHGTPVSMSFFNQDVLSCLQELADEIGFGMWTDPTSSDGHMYVRNYVQAASPSAWGREFSNATSGTVNYVLPASQIQAVRMSPQTFSISGQLDYVAQDPLTTPIQSDFPHAPFPWDAPIVPVYARILQSLKGVITGSLHVFHWWLSNRHVGAVEVDALGHDWLTHNDYVGIHDPTFTGFASNSDYWAVDGWTYEWDGREFRTTIRLAPQLVSLLRNMRRDLR